MASVGRKHIGALDGMRAIAVLIVIASHSGLGHVIPGRFGVTIFFFLSGYLITTLLRREYSKANSIDFKGFYFRRVIRIFPPMYIAIALACLLLLFGQPNAPINYAGLIGDFLFLTNYAPQLGYTSPVPIPLWSLDVEEHFYLLFPMLFLFLCRNMDNARAALACLAICMVVLGIRIVTALVLDDYSGIYFWTHTRIDSILYGCCLALWNNPTEDDGRDYFGSKWNSAILASVLLLSTFVIRDPFFRETFRYTIQGIGLFFLFNFVIRDNGLAATFLKTKALRFIALLSYTLYLVHLPIFIAVTNSLSGAPKFLIWILMVFLSFVVSWLVLVCVERPLGNWRRKKEQQWAAGVPARQS